MTQSLKARLTTKIIREVYFNSAGFLCKLKFETVLSFKENFSETNAFHRLQQRVKWIRVAPKDPAV